MSVINQMLLDLEARNKAQSPAQAGDAGASQHSTEPASEVRAAMAPKTPVRRLPWLLGLLALSGVLAAAWSGWQHWQARQKDTLDLSPQLSVRISEALLPMPALPEQQPLEHGLGAGAAPLPQSSLPTAGGNTYPPAAPVGAPVAAPPPGAYPPATPSTGNYPPAVPASGNYPPAIPAGKAPLGMDALPPTQRRDSTRAEPRGEPAPAAELTPRQQAEAEYRRGQELARAGKSTEAIAYYERALQMDRSFGAARLSLASTLAEAKRVDEAMTRLQEGLDENRANGSLAMMLARLQIDRGDTRAAIDTLGRTLPYDRDRPDYQAFMAGLLQKEGRHKEAIDYYLTALRRTPQNAAWWMGLGLSLQAEKRQGEAREALQRALAIGSLSTDLQGFVQQRLEQMR